MEHLQCRCPQDLMCPQHLQNTSTQSNDEESRQSTNKSNEFYLCKEHNQEKKNYCKNHNQELCINCLQQQHPNCEIVEIKDIKERLIQQYEDQLKQFESYKISQMQNLKKELLSIQRGIYIQENIQRELLNQFQERMNSNIQEFIIDKYNKIAQEKNIQIEKNRDKMKQQEDNIYQEIDNVKSQKYNTITDITNLIQNIQNIPRNKIQNPFKKQQSIDQKKFIQQINEELLNFLFERELKYQTRQSQAQKSNFQQELNQKILQLKQKQQMEEQLEANYQVLSNNQQQNSIQTQDENSLIYLENQTQMEDKEKIQFLEQQIKQLKVNYTMNIVHRFEHMSNKLHTFCYENNQYKSIQIEQEVPIFHRSIQHQDKFYLIGGEVLNCQNQIESSNKIWEVDFDGKCKELQNLNQARSSCGLVVAKDTIFVVGGTFFNQTIHKINENKIFLDSVESLNIKGNNR